ncbi:MerR family transcriptional regulator [Paenibacillus sp. 19GGS1-52]|uniref:MerR family transcriptional regulator n=1 Tax=Paenibacillus sp. 19GGS1-52 TaxID=2758563 RepID=UPI001EFAA408|nr:MerR family transcriptional regulator [Paenibacillus sp. 19GGS1-52]ULO05809.1 MerR family transcriptional regulator [Paenibacillus sp. 19GGS1-52]
MSGFVAIDKLAAQCGLTSRTLRHWETEGLFRSQRDVNSGWRIYDEKARLAIQVIAFLRRFEIGIKDIKPVLAEMSFQSMYQVLIQHSEAILAQKSAFSLKEGEIQSLLHNITPLTHEPITNTLLAQLNEISLHPFDLNNREVLSMADTNTQPIANQVRIVTLPVMRLAYNVAVSSSPEEEAIEPIVEWLTVNNLLGTARLLGGNVPPLPTAKCKPYGYGMCASIPENVEIPEHLKEMRFEGGLYAMIESNDDIFGSWQSLMSLLEKSPEYTADHDSRLCWEEHIRNDRPEGSGNQYLLNLLEPVQKRG